MQARAAVVARQGAAAAFDDALSGRWMLLAPAEASATVQALALAESLLDRYGVVTRDIALAAGVPGGLSALYPALRAMEDAGELVRGHFVEGLGPAQFAARETVDALRRVAEEEKGPASASSDKGEAVPAAARHDVSVVACAADDPACLYGAGLPWPEPAWEAAGEAAGLGSAELSARPSRREGATVVLANGAPVLWAAPRLKQLVAFTPDEDLLAAAVLALKARVLSALKREGAAAARRKIVVETFNGVDVLITPAADLLQKAGFARLPDGMRLYASPF